VADFYWPVPFPLDRRCGASDLSQIWWTRSCYTPLVKWLVLERLIKIQRLWFNREGAHRFEPGFRSSPVICTLEVNIVGDLVDSGRRRCHDGDQKDEASTGAWLGSPIASWAGAGRWLEWRVLRECVGLVVSLQITLVGKSLPPAHQNCLSPANYKSPATLMSVVMHYPWRIALFAGDNCTYCWRIATFARGNLLPLASVAMRQQ
jgi:hypothetical protein